MAEADLSRRQFLNTMVNAVGAGITAILAVPLAGYFLDPAMRKAAGEKNWVKLGPADKLTGSPQQFPFQTVRTEGFMKQNVNATAYAYMDDAGKPVAISNTCTHLGCPAGWDASQEKFLCPCHGGVYDKTGKNIGGPPPRPLPAFEAKVENGDIYINV
jgi:menaquinol-cytochrome c reductase iron-sulfur subunit